MKRLAVFAQSLGVTITGSALYDAHTGQRLDLVQHLRALPCDEKMYSGERLQLPMRLVERGHSDEMILKFLGGNYLRVFEQVWRSDS